MQAIYLRKSRAEEQAGLEETLSKHRKALLELAGKMGFVIDGKDIYEEVVSGESLYARPQMLALLEAVEQEKYDAVLVMDIDRLGRGGMRDQGIILDAFKYSSTRIVTPEKIYDLNDDMDEELTELKTFMSRREYKIINKRLQRGLRQTISEGGYIANAPYGYVKVYKNKKPTLEINEGEAYFVRMIFDLYVNEGMGSVLIANTLNALGAKPHRTDKFGRTSIAQILKNPTYIGQIVWDRKKHIRKGQRGNDKHITIYQPQNNWTITEGLHPPIISKEQFYKAQEIIHSRAHAPSNDGTLKNPMAGLIRCRQCGSLMQRQGANAGVPYILCATKGCVAGAKAEYVESALIDYLGKELYRIELDIPTEDQDNIEYLEKALQATRRELDVLMAQKNRLHDLLEQEVYDIATYRERMEALSQKITASQEREATQEKKIRAARKIDKQALARQIRTVLDAYSAADARHRNMLLKSVLESVEYYKAKKTPPQDFQLFLHLKHF